MTVWWMSGAKWSGQGAIAGNGGKPSTGARYHSSTAATPQQQQQIPKQYTHPHVHNTTVQAAHLRQRMHRSLNSMLLIFA
jgi:hypothetical protein